MHLLLCGPARAGAPGAELVEEHVPSTIRVHGLKLPQRLLVRMQKLLEVVTLDKAVTIRVDGPVRTHQRGLVVEVRPQLDDRPVSYTHLTLPTTPYV